MKKLSLSVALTLVLSAFCCVFPFKAAAAEVGYINSETAVLMDAETGTVLYNKNMHRQMYPASITKIMTGMLALENADTSEVMTTSHWAVYSLPYNTSHIALFEDEQITLEQAMYALGIESANDAANVIAEHISGSEAAFAQLMTQKAHSLGAVNTSFANAHGLPHDNHYTTAYDMALIARAALETEGFAKYFCANRYDMAVTNKRDVVRQFWNANYFINGYERCEGLVFSKTGWTEEARHTLVTAAERNGVTLIAVVMSSSGKGDKYDDTTALFDWGFENYEMLQLSADFVQNNMPGQLNANGVKLTAEKDSLLTEAVSVIVPKGTSPEDIVLTPTEVQIDGSGNMATVEAEIRYRVNGGTLPCGSTKVTLLLADDTMAKPRFDVGAFMQKAVLWLLLVVLWIIVALLVFVVLKQLVILENRRRRRKKRLAALEAKRQKEGTNKTVYRRK